MAATGPPPSLVCTRVKDAVCDAIRWARNRLCHVPRIASGMRYDGQTLPCTRGQAKRDWQQAMYFRASVWSSLLIPKPEGTRGGTSRCRGEPGERADLPLFVTCFGVSRSCHETCINCDSLQDAEMNGHPGVMAMTGCDH